MISNKIKRTAICLSLLATFSCTDNFEEINSNPNGFTEEELKQDNNHIRSLFAPIFNRFLIVDVTWQYQVQQNLNADMWSGYLTTPVVFGGFNNHDYALNSGWTSTPWDDGYLNLMSNVRKIGLAAKGKADQFYAWSLIFKVASMQRLTDMYGPVIYSQHGKTTVPIEYDSQEQVYIQMFKDLDVAVADLTARVKSGEDQQFKKTDLTDYKGSYQKWVKYANSLRLRMAIHIAKVSPALAKTEAEKAVSHELGVMTTNEDVMTVRSPQNLNPIDVISHVWAGLNMGADMESILLGYDDPRVGKFFATSTQFPGEYVGVRTGIIYPTNQFYNATSRTGSVTKSGGSVWMTTAEVYFLRAEGVLRGWNMGGTAKGLYEAGIKASFDQFGVSGADTYLANNVKMPKDYVDRLASTNNIAAVNKVTVAWDEAATKEIKLQKIITQKWIANYPEGQEAWTEFRRTGYPKLFPISNNKSGGIIDTNLGVRRLPFADSEKALNSGGVQTGITKLGGADNGATRLWWDTTGPNF
ncbi:RagB/SusD family nutrient uptake outer membrane protein [Flavobacterium poyangense]|uniref:RagB/SusD family nutrient uptake outer membrane protein n=1 Tax=Flavobacterium poyangense TaxID=2204302 RepID=UPI00142224B9|nr:RagB/SusD family nutrient uptake outer membrane protein [Flavobacterium sp. JXAS1]